MPDFIQDFFGGFQQGQAIKQERDKQAMKKLAAMWLKKPEMLPKGVNVKWTEKNGLSIDMGNDTAKDIKPSDYQTMAIQGSAGMRPYSAMPAVMQGQITQPKPAPGQTTGSYVPGFSPNQEKFPIGITKEDIAATYGTTPQQAQAKIYGKEGVSGREKPNVRTIGGELYSYVPERNDWTKVISRKKEYIMKSPPDKVKGFFGSSLEDVQKKLDEGKDLNGKEKTLLVMQNVKTKSDLEDLIENREQYINEGVDVNYVLEYYNK